MKFIIYITLVASVLLAYQNTFQTPEKAVGAYYNAMNDADINTLEKVMVKSSFDMTMEAWALSKALQDKTFAKTLKQYGQSEQIDNEVIDVVRQRLQNSRPKVISELVSTSLGLSRCIVRYKENGKPKQLYTSFQNNEWKINYKAGRKVD